MLKKQQSQTVAAGRARTIRTADRGILRVRTGGAWITLDGGGHPCCGLGPRGGDWFLAPGDSFSLPRGGRIVLEPRSAGQGVAFDWSPSRGATGDVARRWRRMRRAGRQFGEALVALAAGLVRWRPGLAARQC